ncbi:MAG: phosphatidate cytidylyltransferase [Myxococcota bacterium]
MTEGSTEVHAETAAASPGPVPSLESSGHTEEQSAASEAGAPESDEPELSEAEAAAAKKAARRQDLITRLGTAAVLIPFVLWAIWQGGLIYLGIVIGIGYLAQKEFYGMIEDKGANPIQSVGLGFGAAVILVAHFGNEYHAMLLMTASLLVMMVAQLGKNQISESMASISGTFFGVFYVSWLLSHAVLLRKFYDTAAGHYDPAMLSVLGFRPETGAFFMVYALVTLVACDAGAYFAGRAWGKKKLAPEISPNKSVEGALGGIIMGVTFGLLTKLACDSVRPDWSAAMTWSTALAFAIVLCPVGIIGDLVESLLKRDADVKDTGALLPGMGGVLDRIDAPLLGLPVMYYMMLGYVFFQAA